MIYNNKEKWFTNQELKSLQSLVENVELIYGKKYNVLDVGVQAGWSTLLFAMRTEGDVFAVDTPRFFSPSVKDHIKLNGLTNVTYEQDKDLLGLVKKYINMVDVIFLDEIWHEKDTIVELIEKREVKNPVLLIIHNKVDESFAIEKITPVEKKVVPKTTGKKSVTKK